MTAFISSSLYLPIAASNSALGMLPYHPHIHYIVPAGGISADRKKWLPARNSFYLPVRALSKIFRAKFKAEMVKINLIGQIDPAVWATDWIVNCQAIGNPEASLKYLAPYVFRVAISDSRIIALQNRKAIPYRLTLPSTFGLLEQWINVTK